MKIKIMLAALALIFAGFMLSAQMAAAQTPPLSRTHDAVTVPVENPDEPIVKEATEADIYEEAPQVDATRPAPNILIPDPAEQDKIGAAVPWQMNLPEGVTPVKSKMDALNHMLLIITTAITLLVLGLLLYVVIRFRRKVNPIPSTATHNVKLEIAWTLLPLLILIVIVIPSMRLLWYSDKVVDADMTIVATGYQWYWGYEYPDNDELAFLSNIIPEEDLKPGQLRLLETDNHLVLPVDTNIRILVTANDVLHAFAVPSLGIKVDAVPGRMNETWARIEKEGVYYGQCSELCGVNHGFMPIAVEAVSKERFAEWLLEAKEKFAAISPATETQYAYLGE